jgi:hypothetical protein
MDDARWMVFRRCDDHPVETWFYLNEVDARLAFESVSANWTECFLLRIQDGPSPSWRTPENDRRTARAEMVSCARVVAQEDSRWSRKGYCAICPRELQPEDGFGVVELAEHNFGHGRETLRETMVDAMQYHYALKRIHGFLNSVQFRGWSVETVRAHVMDLVEVALRARGELDDDPV